MKESLGKRILKNLDAWFAGLMFAVTMVLVVINVFTRYLFNYIIPWSEEGCVCAEVESLEAADLRRAVSGCAAAKGWPLLELGAAEMSLENIFLQLTGEGEEK